MLEGRVGHLSAFMNMHRLKKKGGGGGGGGGVIQSHRLFFFLCPTSNFFRDVSNVVHKSLACRWTTGRASCASLGI